MMPTTILPLASLAKQRFAIDIIAARESELKNWRLSLDQLNEHENAQKQQENDLSEKIKAQGSAKKDSKLSVFFRHNGKLWWVHWYNYTKLRQLSSPKSLQFIPNALYKFNCFDRVLANYEVCARRPCLCQGNYRTMPLKKRKLSLMNYPVCDYYRKTMYLNK